MNVAKLIRPSAVGILALGAGCATLPSRWQGAAREMPDEAQYLRPIAQRLGINAASDKKACDLAVDIRLVLDMSAVKSPEPLPEAFIAELKRVITAEELRRMEEAQAFLKKAKGRSVLLLPER